MIVTPDNVAVTPAKHSLLSGVTPVSVPVTPGLLLMLTLCSILPPTLVTPGNEFVTPLCSDRTVFLWLLTVVLVVPSCGSTFLCFPVPTGFTIVSAVLLILDLVITLLLFACFLAADTSPGSPVDLHLRRHFVSSVFNLHWEGAGVTPVTSSLLFADVTIEFSMLAGVDVAGVIIRSVTYASSGGSFSSGLSLVTLGGLDILHVTMDMTQLFQGRKITPLCTYILSVTCTATHYTISLYVSPE